MTMTVRDWALLAQSDYSETPSFGDENSAGRIVCNENENRLILAIPGTNNESCVAADIDILAYDAKELGVVHKGGYMAFNPLWDDVSKLDVYAFVAHSEGCWGAFYLAAKMCLSGRPPKIIYAFEPPHASVDSKLSDIFKKSNVQVNIMWHGNDCIPDFPLTTILFPWRHPAPATRFGKASLPIPNIEDHLMVNIIPDT